jgi:hypothetical protein
VGSAIGTQQRTTGSGSPPTTRSLLVVDCGSVFTKVALLGMVDGRYRMLARSQVPTTIVPPHADVMRGILAGVAEVEHGSARAIVRDGSIITPERDNGDGVDGVAVTVSAGGPVHLLMAGPGRDALAALVHRAAGGLFVSLDPLPLDVAPPSFGGARGDWERQVAVARAQHPHGVLVVGPSVEGQRGRPDLDETGRIVAAWIDALRTQPSDVPYGEIAVLFAGSPPDAARLRASLGGHATTVEVGSLAPTTLAPLSQAIAGLYESSVLRGIPGYEGLRALSRVPLSGTVSSLAGIARYLSQHYQLNVVGVDVGANSTMLVGATAQGGFMPASHPGAGVGPGAGAVLRAVGAANVLRWLPETLDEAELREYVLGRMLRRGMLPSSNRELEIEYALAREAIQLALRAPGSTLAGMHPVDVLLGSGGTLAHAPSPVRAAMVLLDAVQPRGITSLALDVAQLGGMLGGLAAIDPTAAGQIAEGDTVRVQLASVVSTFGSVPEGQPAVRVILEHGDGQRQTLDVAHGALARLPLHPGERALLSLVPAPTVDVGLGAGQQARASEPLDGSLLGLIVDARGRPLVLPRTEEARVARIREWRQALGILS